MSIMSHTHGDSNNQKASTHDNSFSDVNVKVKRFHLSYLWKDDQKKILITAETEKSTIEKMIPLKLEHPTHFGLLLWNYNSSESDDYFSLNSTVRVKEILLKKSITESDDSNLENQLENIIENRIKHIITRKKSDCRYLCEKAIKDEYTTILQMKLEIIDTNNSYRRFAFYLDDDSGVLLCRAIIAEDMEAIEVLLNLKFNINARIKAGWTPLHVAVGLEMSDVDILIGNGANVNILDNYHQVLHHFTVEKNSLKILDSLPNDQAKLNKKSRDDQTPFHNAVFNGNVEVVNFFLKKGADYKLKNINCLMPFYLAAKQVNLDMIKVFLDNNVDANIVNSCKETPLHTIGRTTFTSSFGVKAAAKETYLKIINALLKKETNINFQDLQGNTPLHHAVAYKNSELVQALLECNADSAIKNNNGDNVLHLASRSGRADNFIQDILDSNVDINAVNSYGDTALHLAIQQNDDNIVKTILTKNPNIDMKNNFDNTALHEAVKFKQYHMVDLLLKNGANVNLQDADGKTVLHSAAKLPKISIEIVESILNYINDIDAKDKRGRTALHYAALNTDDRTLKTFLKAKADINIKDSEGNTPLDLIMSRENRCVPCFESMQVFVNYQADVNAVGNHMRTPLHHACWTKKVEAVKYLIKNGADSSMRDRDGRTVFYYACMIKEDIYYDIEGFGNLLDILIEVDVSVNCVNKSGKTPLHHVIEEYGYWSCDIHKLLLKIGADINIEDKEHNTVIDTLLKECNTVQYQKIKPFIEHVIKMKEMGMWVRAKTLDKFNKMNNQYDLQKIQLYERDYHKEVDLMNINIDQSDITYYDFLKKSPHKAVNYSRNENIANIIKSDELSVVFPIYGNFLKCHLRDIQRRCNLYKKIQRFLKSNILRRLPSDCMHEIFQYLNNSDLNIFLQVLKPVVLIK
ncbi:putative ankyrin repeat protein RF_0381 [Chelonus insularis]|uniref:putative ankyrin repeat protein RF_0381 n=1 Tax=Chelonus insularis TaxID=460826 RepID=UPI00158EEABA|nr:putative ankyrin repeat protein RF_0381 [Chelonus insularis]